MTEFFHQFHSPRPEISLVIEDNGRVAYAYLLENRRVVADVWLYNQASTPDIPEWKDPSKAPFLNPSEYVQQPKFFEPLRSLADLTVEWSTHAAVARVQIQIRGHLHATLAHSEKPGHSRFARKDGPLAKVLPAHEGLGHDEDVTS